MPLWEVNVKLSCKSSDNCREFLKTNGQYELEISGLCSRWGKIVQYYTIFFLKWRKAAMICTHCQVLWYGIVYGSKKSSTCLHLFIGVILVFNKSDDNHLLAVLQCPMILVLYLRQSTSLWINWIGNYYQLARASHERSIRLTVGEPNPRFARASVHPLLVNRFTNLK